VSKRRRRRREGGERWEVGDGMREEKSVGVGYLHSKGYCGIDICQRDCI
jgi:hypothetical protein